MPNSAWGATAQFAATGDAQKKWSGMCEFRAFMTEWIDPECDPDLVAASGNIGMLVEHPDLQNLLQLFLDQGWPIRSIVVGGDQVHTKLRQDDLIACFGSVHKNATTPTITSSNRARQLLGDVPGNDLLLSPAHILNQMMPPCIDEFGFQGVAALSSPRCGRSNEDDFRKLRRSLFDRGLVCIGSVQMTGCTALCFLTSDAVRSLHHCHVGSIGHVTMSELGNAAGFANQLFRYAYVKFYALRHSLTPAFPKWCGNQLFELVDESCAHLNFRRLTFNGFTNHHRLLWDERTPPINVDLNGYFQDIPACWGRHRTLLRRLFALPPEQQNAIEAWRDGATRGGQRTLVAIHVRRGDYRQLQQLEVPWFRLVPERWYLDWLRTIWPTLSDPLLFVATDEPDAIRPVFAEFETISADFDHWAQRLPPHVRDFEILRRADYLAVCNSSFSRMAAILGPSTQKCFIPSFRRQCFEPYQPWLDDAFWDRFKDAWHARCATSHDRRQSGSIASNTKTFATEILAATIYFDISDLLLYLQHHVTLSGIQRVQCEILSRVAQSSNTQAIRFVVINEVGGLGEIDKITLLKVIGDIGADAESRARMAHELRALPIRAKPCAICARDIFVTIGAFWGVTGMGRLLQELKNSGVVIGVFIHDILPITAPEYFEAPDTRVFVKGIVEALSFAEFVLTSSEYNKRSLLKHMAGQRMEPLPVHVVPLAHEIPSPQPTSANVSSGVAEIVSGEYVLCVGTIEVRKNPTYLFHIWKLMVQSGRAKIPTLVFAGRKGWLVKDFIDQLNACNYLDGKIVLVQHPTDGELALLYRNCILTVFPSFAEGWGLPVGESLAHGKITVCADAGGTAEVGGKLLDYIDPYNVRGGLELLLRYLDDPVLRHNREDEISRQFEPRSWQNVTEEFLSSIQAIARQLRPSETIAAIKLPPNRFLPVSANAVARAMDGIDGALSAELACVQGWRASQAWGAQPDARVSILRFRADASAGTKVNMVMQLALLGTDCCRLWISSACGAETHVTLKGGSDSLAVLSCEVEPDQLITIHFSMIDAWLDQDDIGDAPCWVLKEFLYFNPEHLTQQTAKKFTESGALQSSSTRPVNPADSLKDRSRAEQVPLPQNAAWDHRQRATSFGAFLKTTDSYWQSDFTSHRDAPIFADQTDKEMFFSDCGNYAIPLRVGEIHDSLKLVRRSNQFVSMSRFTEGSIFDRSAVGRNLGYLQTCAQPTSWLANSAGGLSLNEQFLAAAPFYKNSYLVFYNGNLHNYYHWVVEGLLLLDILSRALGSDSKLKIALPKSMHIDEVFDHRDSLTAVGFDQYEIVEIAENLIKVQEAIWVDSDLVQSMPAPYLRNFQQRVAARYIGLCGPRNRRLFIARKGPARTIHNFEQVQACITKYGFETVYLEGQSIVDQILLFLSAQFVIGAHGAALTNLLFCQPGTKVIEFMPSVELRPFFWLISDKLDLVYGMQYCTPSGSQGFQSAMTVDVDKLERLLRVIDAHA